MTQHVPKFNGLEKKQFVNWTHLKQEQLRILVYKEAFDPEVHMLDRVGMMKALGAPPDFNDTEQMKAMMKHLMKNQMESLYEREKRFAFLKKVPGYFDESSDEGGNKESSAFYDPIAQGGGDDELTPQ